MNRDLPPPSVTLRSVCAIAAVLITLLEVRSIDGLLDHYNGAAQQAGVRATQLAKALGERPTPDLTNGVLATMGPGIQYVESFVTGDKIYCVYRADSEEATRKHAFPPTASRAWPP